MLARDAKRRAVLHQGGVADVGHLRAPHPLTDPAHDIAEDPPARCCRAPSGYRPVRGSGRRGGGSRGCRRAPPAPRGRSPSGVPPRSRDDSESHAGWRRSARAPTRWSPRPGDDRPSAPSWRPSHPGRPTSPCRSGRGRQAPMRARRRHSMPRTPRSSARTVISVFGITGPASIEVWISSPVRSRKPVLMKITRGARGADALGEVHGGPPFLVHDADLDGVHERGRGHPRPAETAPRWRRPPPGRGASA